MSDIACSNPDNAATAQLGPTPRHTYIGSVVRGTLSRHGARIGFGWILALACCAVLAPLLANTHPLMMKTTDGVITSPFVKHLSAADTVLMAAPVLGLFIFILLRRLSIGQRLLIWLGCVILIAPLTLMLAKPPLTVIYDAYREMDRKGKIAWQLRAPIPYSPTDRQRDQPEKRLQPPSRHHWLGTNQNGADVLSRMIHASRIALAVGFISTGIALTVGIIVGALMGYFSRGADLIGMRIIEIFEAVPQLYLLLAFVAFFPRNLYIMMAIIGFTSWTGYARFTRAEFLKLRKMDYVHAATASGLPLWSILFRHMLPNGVAPVLVAASFGVASAILAESFLSFLGLGLVDEPSWGQLLNQALGASGGFSWWIALYPGMAIFLTVYAYNLIGESLRDAIDPYLTRESQL